MSDAYHFVLAHEVARRMAAEQCKLAPDGWHVIIKPPTRNLDQNALLHAILTDISEQVEWMGKKLSVDVWKRLCMAAWMRESGSQPMLVPALDGNGFDVVFERTSKLSVKQMAELIEWCLSFGAEHGVVFKEEA